jgi:phosphate transport system substrate-binding protein
VKIPSVCGGLLLLAGLVSCHKSEVQGSANGTITPNLIQNRGSDTMLEVAQALAEVYATKVDPSVRFAVNGGGSGTGISALINGTTDIANCSRKFKDKELEEARAHGHDPKEFHVGYDGIAIYVNKDNPIQSLTIAQLRDMYVEGGKLDSWSQLGVKVPASASEKIVLVNRQNNSGTREYFREGVLGEDGRFKADTIQLNGSIEVVDFCGKTPGAIGFAGLAAGVNATTVKMVPIAKTTDDKAVHPSIDTVLDHTYPISRPLFMYTSGEPKGLVKKYLDWILSDAGQQVLQDKGYPPLHKLH